MLAKFALLKAPEPMIQLRSCSEPVPEPVIEPEVTVTVSCAAALEPSVRVVPAPAVVNTKVTSAKVPSPSTASCKPDVTVVAPDKDNT